MARAADDYDEATQVMVMRSGAIVLLTMLISTACVGSDAVRPGMAEGEVIATLGTPSEVVDEADRMQFYSTFAKCGGMERMRAVFWYRKWIPSDIFVALDSDKKVVCSWEADVIEFVE
jgi:hypothetical protein